MFDAVLMLTFGCKCGHLVFHFLASAVVLVAPLVNLGSSNDRLLSSFVWSAPRVSSGVGFGCVLGSVLDRFWIKSGSDSINSGLI